MGIAAADYSLDGRDDLFVTNSRRQLHAAYRARAETAFATPGPSSPRRSATTTRLGRVVVDLDLDGNLELVLANGAIPCSPDARAQRVQVLEHPTAEGHAASSQTRASPSVHAGQRVNGRGLAAADYDNDGDVESRSTRRREADLLRNSAPRGHWLEVESAVPPGTRVTAVLPGGRRLVREPPPGAATSPRRIPACTSASGPRRGSRADRALPRTAGRIGSTNVAADRIWCRALTPF